MGWWKIPEWWSEQWVERDDCTLPIPQNDHAKNLRERGIFCIRFSAVERFHSRASLGGDSLSPSLQGEWAKQQNSRKNTSLQVPLEPRPTLKLAVCGR